MIAYYQLSFSRFKLLDFYSKTAVVVIYITLLNVVSGGVLAWLSIWSEVQTCIWPSRCHCHSLSLASVKYGLVLPFWYRLTRVVLDKGPLNGCVY